MWNSTIYVKTPSTGLAITLADAKLHLRVDDTVPGAASQVIVGGGDAALKLAAILSGERGNNYSIALIKSFDNDRPLMVTFEADAITVNLQTDSNGDAISTANDIIAALVAVPNIAQRFIISADEGTGTGIMAPQSKTNFSGGVDGTSAEDSLITNLIRVAQSQSETITRRSLLNQTLVYTTNVFPGCRHLILERGPIRSVIVKYVDEDGIQQTFTADQYWEYFEAVPEYIELKSNVDWPRTLTNKTRAVSIEMQCGYATEADIPVEIQQAIRMMVAYWYSVRENVIISSGISGVVVPQGAEWLLWPYRDFRF